MDQHNNFGGHRSSPSIWDKIWRDKEGDVVIFQWPNVWIIGWAAANFISLVSPTRGLSKITWWIGFVFIMVWALLEIFKGTNYFRRGLGLIIMLLSILSAIHGGF